MIKQVLFFSVILFNTCDLFSQLTESGYVFGDPTLSKCQIKKKVNEIYRTVDSVRTEYNFKGEVKFFLCVFYNNLSDSSEQWNDMVNIFVKLLEKEVEKKNVEVLSPKKITANQIIKEDHLGIRVVFL